MDFRGLFRAGSGVDIAHDGELPDRVVLASDAELRLPPGRIASGWLSWRMVVTATESVNAEAPARKRENPGPADLYNLVVLGGGYGGILAALEAARAGAKVALVERDQL